MPAQAPHHAPHPWAQMVRSIGPNAWNLTIDADLAPLRRIAGLVDSGGPEAEALLLRAMQRSVAWLRTQVVDRTPVGATGRLRQSIEDNVEVIQALPIHIRGEVTTDVRYALPVEVGTRPHRPPIAPLIYWAQRKFQLSDKAAKHVAYAVREAIARRGTRAQRMFHDGWDSALPYITAQFERTADEMEALIRNA